MAAYIACQRGNITAVVCISQLLDRLEAAEGVQVFKYSSIQVGQILILLPRIANISRGKPLRIDCICVI